ncbi:MAG: hypothetical protein FJZ90_14040 [Chloroflexi bacterium]|nr:hypothetical protein [Chloroflexota bacterium]
MKLLVAIVRDDYEADVIFALNAQGFSVTRISTTGGFWRRGNTTLLVGTEDERVPLALQAIDEHAGPVPDTSGTPSTHPPHRATIFVLDVDSFEHY